MDHMKVYLFSKWLMWRINHQPHRSTFLCRLTLQTQTCRQNWGDISASIWWPEFWDLIWINLQRPCFQKTVQQLGLIVSYNTATSCSELQDFYITRPLWCLRAQFGLISCCQGQVGFFEDKGGLLYKERKKKKHASRTRWDQMLYRVLFLNLSVSYQSRICA